MARDHARVKCSVWVGKEWQGLPLDAQWLYLHLLSQPRLTYCGSVDWRPSKIAKASAGLTPQDVERAALPLEQAERPFMVIDRDTEEAVIRTFIKHDGLLGNGNVTIAMVKAWDNLESETLKGVVTHELGRLHESHPGMRGFTDPRPWEWVQKVLKGDNITPSEAVSKLPPNPERSRLRSAS